MLNNLYRKSPLAIFFLIFLYCCSSAAQQPAVADIVNPKDHGGGYVSNSNGIISGAAVARLDGMLKKLDQDRKAQVAVVLVNSIGNAVPKEFATALFRKWGIGDKRTNNGLLVLLIKDQRRIEFEVGYGLEGVLPDMVCYRIQQKAMVPQLKQGHYDDAVVDGLQLVSDRLYASKEALSAQDDELATARSAYPQWELFYDFIVSLLYLGIFTWFTLSAFGQRLVSTSCWWGILLFLAPILIITLMAIFTNVYMTWPVFLLVFYGCWCVTTSLYFTIELSRQKSAFFKSRYEQYRKMRFELRDLKVYTLLFPLPLLIFQFIRWKMWLKDLRYRPYYSEKCKADMVLLKRDKSAYLSKGQQMEESLKSREYDIWIVPGCDDELRFVYDNATSKIVKCNQCKNKTGKLVGTKKIISATSKREGLRSMDYVCQCCGSKFSQKRSIPKKEIFFKIGNAGAGGGSRSGSSSGGSSGSSSGSWGGGSSGGGGAGSNW